MTAEYTTEEMVTKLLLANDFVSPSKTVSNPVKNNSLGKFLSEIPEKEFQSKNFSKYSFIDETINWGF